MDSPISARSAGGDRASCSLGKSSPSLFIAGFCQGAIFSATCRQDSVSGQIDTTAAEGFNKKRALQSAKSGVNKYVTIYPSSSVAVAQPARREMVAYCLINVAIIPFEFVRGGLINPQP